MIRLVTFDLDDTFWDVAKVMNHAEDTLRQWLGQHAPQLGAVPLEHLWRFRQQLLSDEPLLKFRLSELRQKILYAALMDASYSPSQAHALAQQGFEVFLEARHQVSFFDHLTPTLTALKAHYRLAVITNGNADIRRLGLAEYFDFAVSAEQLGVGKPHPEPFLHALERAGVAPEQAVHIGDHPNDDIFGAQQAGLSAIWFNPGQKAWTGAIAPEAQIQALNELPPLLANWPTR